MVTGYQRVNEFTKDNRAWLEEHGYYVEEITIPGNGVFLKVTGSRFLDELQLNDPGSLIRLSILIKEKELLTYRTKIHTPMGTYSSLPAIYFLGTHSALMCTAEPTPFSRKSNDAHVVALLKAGKVNEALRAARGEDIPELPVVEM